MVHLWLFSGVIDPSQARLPASSYGYQTLHGTRVRVGVRLSEKVLRHEQLLNFNAYLIPSYKEAVSHGTASYLYLLRELRHRYIPYHFTRHLGIVAADLYHVALYTLKQSLKVHPRRNRVEMLRIENNLEQAPNPDSRVMLAAERDQLGLPRVKLAWQLSPMDKYSLFRAHHIMCEELDRTGSGQLRHTLRRDTMAWPYRLIGSAHHIGTTRMHVAPKQGVVDENCKVHGIANLFLTGSSVFPTGGVARPTLTIVALAIKLADQVKHTMRGTSPQ